MATKPKTKKKPANKAAAKPAKKGRPTDYRPEYCQQIIDFFNVPATKVLKTKELDKSGELVETERTVANDLPILAAFCCLLGVHRDTLHEWATRHPEFSDAVKKAKEHQERILVANGMQGYYDKTFAIFTAKNLIGWRDKLEIDAKVDLGLADAMREARERATNR